MRTTSQACRSALTVHACPFVRAEYLEALWGIAKLGQPERELLVSRDAIMLLIQFYCGDHVALDSAGVRVRSRGDLCPVGVRAG